MSGGINDLSRRIKLVHGRSPIWASASFRRVIPAEGILNVLISDRVIADFDSRATGWEKGKKK